MGLPARGYKWADAAPGNLLNLRHGARSRRVYEPIAVDLAAALLEERPDLEDYPDAVTQWAEAEARAELLRRWIADKGLFDGDDAPRSGALTWLRLFEGQAESARKTLGLDPRSHAELVRVRAEATTQTFDLEALMARGREVRLAAERRLALEAETETTAADSCGEGSTCAGAVGDTGQVDAAGSRGSSTPAPRSPNPVAQ